MHATIKDKPAIVMISRLQFKLLTVLLVLLIAGCATGPETGPDHETEADREAAAEQADLEPQPIREPVDPDVLFHIMAAERLGAQGEEALDHYLEAARLSEDPEVAEQVARMAMGMEEWERAVEAAHRWQELAPGSVTAAQVKASAWIRMGDSESAADALYEMIQASENPDRGWQMVAVLLGAAEDREFAEELMTELMDRADAKDDFSALWGQSVLAWRMDDIPLAIQRAERAAEVEADPELLIWIAQLHVSEENLEQALDYFNQVRAMDTGDIQADLAAVEILRQMNRDDEALEVIRSLPESTESLYTMGEFLADTGREDAAVRVWERLATLDPEQEDLHAFYTAQLAEQLGMKPEAIGWFSRIDAGQFRVRAALRKAWLLAEEDQVDQARAVLADLRVAESPDTMERSWLAEGQILQDAGKHDEAMSILSEALTTLSQSTMLLYSRALVAVALDDLSLAEQDLRRILQLDTDHAMALNALGYTLTDRTDRHREAYRLISRALELEPDHPAVLDSMGWVKYRLGKPEEAEPYLRQALAGDDNPEILAHLVEVLWTLDRHEEARRLLADSLKRHPNDRHLVDTRDRLGVFE